MIKWISILAIQFVAISAIAQNQLCGLKTDCLCATNKESIAYYFEYSDVIIHGRVIDIDTLRISEIITEASILKIEEDASNQAECAKEVLDTRKIVQAEVAVEAVYKGQPSLARITVTTPLDEASCGYAEFRAGQHYIVYGTSNKTADAYFLWTFDMDYFQLQPEFSAWTNQCKATKLAEKNELEALDEIKNRLNHR